MGNGTRQSDIGMVGSQTYELWGLLADTNTPFAGLMARKWLVSEVKSLLWVQRSILERHGDKFLPEEQPVGLDGSSAWHFNLSHFHNVSWLSPSYWKAFHI